VKSWTKIQSSVRLLADSRMDRSCSLNHVDSKEISHYARSALDDLHLFTCYEDFDMPTLIKALDNLSKNLQYRTQKTLEYHNTRRGA